MIEASRLSYLDAAIRAAGVPIDGLARVDGAVRIDFNSEATEQQRAQARTIADAFNFDAPTPREIEDDALLLERAQIGSMLDDIQAQRSVDRATWDAYTANQLRAEQWRDRQVLLRFANFLARRVKQEIQ
jgi:hypothetical protein